MGKWTPVEAFRKNIDLLIAGKFDQLPVTDDCEVTEPAIGSHIGWDEERQQAVRDYVRAFSNYNIIFTNTVTQGNKCAVQVQYEMDHTGPMVWPDRTIPATGKHLKLMAAYFVTFNKEGEGALITKIHNYYDPMELLQQMGLM